MCSCYLEFLGVFLAYIISSTVSILINICTQHLISYLIFHYMWVPAFAQLTKIPFKIYFQHTVWRSCHLRGPRAGPAREETPDISFLSHSCCHKSFHSSCPQLTARLHLEGRGEGGKPISTPAAHPSLSVRGSVQATLALGKGCQDACWCFIFISTPVRLW